MMAAASSSAAAAASTSTSTAFRCTVITVTYNPGACLPAAVDSVAALGRSDIEHLIVDGASTDGTREWLQAQAPRQQWRYVSEPDQGIYDAMRKGIAAARGQSIIFLGADDILLPGALELIDHPRCGEAVLYGDVELTSNAQRYAGPFSTGKLCLCNICHQALCYPRELLLAHSFDSRYRWLADHALNLRLWGLGTPFVYVDTVVSRFNDGGGSSAGEEAFARDLPQLIRANLGWRWAWWYRYRMARNRCKRLFTRS